jgi:hypothetical protein
MLSNSFPLTSALLDVDSCTTTRCSTAGRDAAHLITAALGARAQEERAPSTKHDVQQSKRTVRLGMAGCFFQRNSRASRRQYFTSAEAHPLVCSEPP